MSGATRRQCRSWCGSAKALAWGFWNQCRARRTFRTTTISTSGNHWNHPFQNEALAEADVILVIDSDVPWIPTVNRPSDGARIYHIDVDPLKQAMPLWHIDARRSFQADAATALRQLNALSPRRIRPRAAEWQKGRSLSRAAPARAPPHWRSKRRPAGPVITPEYLTAVVRRHIGRDAIVLNEGITNYPAICDHIAPTRPGAFFASGGGSLGWSGGAAIGAKLAAPDKTVAALTGDGSYMFSVPSTVHWMARHYRTPFLHGGLQQPRLEGAEVLGARRASRRLCQPRQRHRRRLRPAARTMPASPRRPAAPSPAPSRRAARWRMPSPEAVRVVREEKRAAVLDVWLERL